MKLARKVALMCLITMVVCTITTEAQIIKYLNGDWLVYDHETQEFFPFVKKNKKTLPLHLLLEQDQYKGTYLSVKSASDVSLYVNNEFYKEFKAGDRDYVPVNNIRSGSGKTLLSLYGNYNEDLIDSIAITYSPIVHNPHSNNNSLFATARKNNYSKSYFSLIFLLALTFFVSLKANYSKAYNIVFDLKDLFFNYKAEIMQSRASIEGYYFAFILLGSLFFSLSIAGLPIPQIINNERSLGVFAMTVLNLTIIAIFFYLLKFIAIYTISWLFSIGKLAPVHFKVFVNISILWSAMMVLVSMINLSELHYWYNLDHLVLIISIFFLTLTSFKVSIIINRAARVSTLYLISYLCITEWLPYLIILKLYTVYFY